MATTPTQVRIPPALLAAIDAAAEVEGLTRTAWLLRAATDSLGVARSSDPMEVKVAAAPVLPPHLQKDLGKTHFFSSEVKFKCPVHPACAFRAPSAAARCPTHGRQVIPV